MPANAKPLTVYGNGNRLRKALRRKIASGRQLLSELDAVESRWTSHPLGVSALTQAMDDSISYNAVTDALPTWERGVRNLLRTFLGAYANDVLPEWESRLDRDAPAGDLVADQRAFIEGRMIDLASLLQRVPGHPIDAAPPIFAELRAARLLHDDVLDGYIRRMSKTTKPAGRSEAIGAVKELLEAVFKATLDKTGVPYTKGDEMPTLGREVRRVLKSTDMTAPTPDGVNHLDRMFTGLATVEQAITELRNTYGSGHGRPAHPDGLAQRHALLAVDAAAAHVRYLVLTLEDLGLLAGSPDA